MSLETVAERRRKRIVEHSIGLFRNAPDAILFGNTVEKVVQQKIGKIKFRQYVGAPDTTLAITPDYQGETVLKTIFLEIPNNDAALHICQLMELSRQFFNTDHGTEIRIINEIVREKPQPQFIGN